MKRWMGIVIGAVALAGLLGGAAFVAGKMLSARAQPQASGSGGPVLMQNNGKVQQQVKLDMKPAAELPQTPAELKGIYLRRADASVFVGTGQVQVSARKKPDGTIDMSSSHDGPEVEVVVTHDTVIYQDVTMAQFNGQLPTGPTQQVVEPAPVDNIGENSMITVWGERRGDRVTASTLVFTPPAILKKSPAQ